MIHLKKLIMTLALLLTAATGAWAQTGENIFQYCYDCQRSPGYPTTMASAELSKFKNPYVGYKGIGSGTDNTSDGPWKLEYVGLWSTTDKHEIDDVSNYQSLYNCTDVPVFRLYQWNATANEYQHAAYGVVCCYAKVSNAADHTVLFEAEGHWGCVLTNKSHSSSMNITFDEDLTTGLTTLIAAATPSSATPVDIAWNAATKTGTFKMPGGNVTLAPEYYPQAAVADGGVTAADADARATTDDPLVKVDATKLTGAKKLMYFVSNSGTTAPAYDAEGWTDQLPNAESLTQQGIVYVWYYPVGTDEGVDGATATYSDGDMNATALTVTIAAEPTYAVTFAEGFNPEPPAEPEWTASPAADVKKGQTVTVTYTGSKKVIGVKAEKKAAAPASIPLDNTTTAWTAGTYAVPAGGLTYSDAITVSGDVTLTLTDGTTLTLNKGISLASGATLTVEGNGAMVVNGTNNSTASTVAGSTGTLILTSGTLTATGGNGESVGPDYEVHGGNGGDAINGSVIVSGGTLTARGGNGGSVSESSDTCSGGNGGDAISGTLTINGGSTSVNDGSNGSIGKQCDNCTAGTGGKAVAGNVTDNR